MYSTHNERTSVIAERFIRTLKYKIFQYMISFSKYFYIDKLDDIVNKYSNTYHDAIKMKTIDVKRNTYIDYSKKSEVKKTVPWTYVISDLKGEKVVEKFYENELQITNQKELKIGKVIKRKGDKLHVKWKGYDNSFNSWIDKNDINKV